MQANAPSAMVIAYYVVLVFWLIDTYFLWQEKLFRKLYDLVRQRNAGQIDFSMDTSAAKNEVRVFGVIFSGPSLGFCIIMALGTLLMGYVKGFPAGN